MADILESSYSSFANLRRQHCREQSKRDARVLVPPGQPIGAETAALPG